MAYSRGEAEFVNLPGFAARLYGRMMQGAATRQQYVEIARDLASRIEKGRLLDIGTGPGFLLLELHRLHPTLELHGLDISAAMIDLARGNLSGIPVDLRQGNITATDYPTAYFDLVTCSGSFYLWDQPLQGLEEICRILKGKKSAYLYETHREVDVTLLKRRMRENLKGEGFLRQILAPRFFLKQLSMTYNKAEIRALLEGSPFAASYKIEEIEMVRLPVWLRIELEK